MKKEISERLSKLPVWMSQMVFDLALGYDSVIDIAKKYKKSRYAIYHTINNNEDFKWALEEIKKYNIEKRAKEWENLIDKATSVYKEILFNGKESYRFKVATEILKGTGSLSENSNINMNVKSQLNIIRPSKE